MKHFAVACLLGLGLVFSAGCRSTATETANASQTPESSPTTSWWVRGTLLRVTGQGWHGAGDAFRRLPPHAEAKVTAEVWRLSKHTAGLTIEFTTDATELHVAWSGGGAMRHMPATGVSGVDLYRRDGDGRWVFHAVGVPEPGLTERQLVSKSSGASHDYLLFLPLYQEVSFLAFRLNEGAHFSQPAGDTAEKPVVFYGTSVVQGGCASRAGMAHPAILRRWLDREVINLGFSGAGKMELPMADLLAEIDASVYVVDCLPNMTFAMVEERFEPFLRRLREVRPDTPVLLVEHLALPRDHPRNQFVRDTYERLLSEGWNGLALLPGDRLLAGPEEGTVDGIHPTDLGFFRMAEAHLPLLQSLWGDKAIATQP